MYLLILWSSTHDQLSRASLTQLLLLCSKLGSDLDQIGHIRLLFYENGQPNLEREYCQPSRKKIPIAKVIARTNEVAVASSREKSWPRKQKPVCLFVWLFLCFHVFYTNRRLYQCHRRVAKTPSR